MFYSGRQEQNAFQKKIYVTSLLQSKCSMDSNPCLQKGAHGRGGGLIIFD